MIPGDDPSPCLFSQEQVWFLWPKTCTLGSIYVRLNCALPHDFVSYVTLQASLKMEGIGVPTSCSPFVNSVRKTKQGAYMVPVTEKTLNEKWPRIILCLFLVGVNNNIHLKKGFACILKYFVKALL